MESKYMNEMFTVQIRIKLLKPEIQGLLLGCQVRGTITL